MGKHVLGIHCDPAEVSVLLDEVEKLGGICHPEGKCPCNILLLLQTEGIAVRHIGHTGIGKTTGSALEKLLKTDQYFPLSPRYCPQIPDTRRGTWVVHAAGIETPTLLFLWKGYNRHSPVWAMTPAWAQK